MSYYYTSKSGLSFTEAINKVTEELKKEGFGIITEIDVKKTFKEKLNAEFRNYKILGACNPNFAYQAIQQEDKIGTMLPCNVIVQETPQGEIEISAINPMESMSSVENEKLQSIATEVSKKLKTVIGKI